jgi:hypothetical protein
MGPFGHCGSGDAFGIGAMRHLWQLLGAELWMERALIGATRGGDSDHGGS